MTSRTQHRATKENTRARRERETGTVAHIYLNKNMVTSVIPRQSSVFTSDHEDRAGSFAVNRSDPERSVEPR